MSKRLAELKAQKNEIAECRLVEGSSEWFVQSYGSNRGFTQLQTKLGRNLFISHTAKFLYWHLYAYAYGRDFSYPSYQRLQLETGISKDCITKYVKELEDLGLISVRRKVTRNNVYYFPELREVPVIYHSEIIYMIRDELVASLKTDSGEDVECVDFYEAWAKYKESKLCTQVKEFKCYKEVLEAEPLIKVWFNKVIFEGREPEIAINRPLEQETELTTCSTTRRKMNVKNDPLSRLAGNYPVDAKAETSEPQPKKKIKNVDYSLLPIEDWSLEHFLKFFIDTYQFQYKTPYLQVSIGKDRKQLSNLLKLRTDIEGEAEAKKKIKRYIELYIIEDFFTLPKSLATFSSNFVQGMLDKYQQTGSFYRKKENIINSFSDSETDEAYLQRIREEFGEDA